MSVWLCDMLGKDCPHANPNQLAEATPSQSLWIGVASAEPVATGLVQISPLDLAKIGAGMTNPVTFGKPN
jgi:hypothetical protein